MRRLSLTVLILAVVAATICLAEQHMLTNLGPAEYYRPPQLTLMIGYIKDPQHKDFTVSEWAKGIGKNFDAVTLVSRAKKAGVAQIIWYDKWIDGLVFRKTKTTSYVTEKDFLAELAPECRRNGIKLVTYFNTYYDDNPEFVQWAATDQRGQPIKFSPLWPCNLLSMYSPFREKALEQIRELLVDYSVDGIWLDVPDYVSLSYDKWTRDAFRKQTGKEMHEATPAERRKFAVDSVVNWNREVAAFARKLKPSATVTTNGLIEPFGSGPRLAIGKAEPLDYFSTELHARDGQLQVAPSLSHYLRPYEAGTLISDDWFTPLNSGPLKTSKSVNQMHVELARLYSAGLNVYLALALGHDGSTHDGTMRLLEMSGEWLRARRAWLAGAENFHDVGIFLGTADPQDLTWSGGHSSYNSVLYGLEDQLRANGHLPCRIVNSANTQKWDSIPEDVRTLIVPDRVSLNATDAERVRQFARRGGRVLAFGRGMGLAKSGESGQAADIFGVQSAGFLGGAETSGALELLLGEKQVALAAPVIHLSPRGAEVLLWGKTRMEGEMPALTRNRAGSGSVYAVPFPESALAKSPEVLDELWKDALPDALWKADGKSKRCTVRIRRQPGRYVVHVIDDLMPTPQNPMGVYRPGYLKLSLNAASIRFQKATVMPDNRPLKITSSGAWSTIEVYPDPELIIVLE